MPATGRHWLCWALSENRITARSAQRGKRERQGPSLALRAGIAPDKPTFPTKPSVRRRAVPGTTRRKPIDCQRWPSTRNLSSSAACWPLRLPLSRWRSAAGTAHSAAPKVPAPKNAELADRETWDILAMQGVRVGYEHTTIRGVRDAGREEIRVEQTTHMAIERFGQATVLDISGSCTETPQGRLLDFQSEIRQGPTPLRSTGKVQGDRLVGADDEHGQGNDRLDPVAARLRRFLRRRGVAPAGADAAGPAADGQRPGRQQPGVANGFDGRTAPAGETARRRIRVAPHRRGDADARRAGRAGNVLDRPQRRGVEEPRGNGGGRDVPRDEGGCLGPARAARLDFGLDMLVPLDGRLPRGHETQRAAFIASNSTAAIRRRSSSTARRNASSRSVRTRRK